MAPTFLSSITSHPLPNDLTILNRFLQHGLFSLSRLYTVSLSVTSSVKPSLGLHQRHTIFSLLFNSFDLIVRQGLG